MSRVASPEGPLVRKQALGPQARKRAGHERAMLERLAGVGGVPRLVRAEDDAIELEDVGGRSLAEVLAGGAIELSVGLRLIEDLARVVAGIHAAGVIHHDLNPANIVVRPRPDGTLEPFLVDFDLAATFVQLRPDPVESTATVWRLSHMAPEQTGRTGRPTDQRSDLYSLGATIHEIVIGEPPFPTSDPLRLVRQILTEVPLRLVERTTTVPPMLSAIVERLLEKEPDARYQSAGGLVHDLGLLVQDPERCFELGGRDFPSQLVPPARPIGRDDQYARLLAALDRSSERTEAVLVAGSPGVGKSSLVEQLRPEVGERGGWFIAGKANQYQRDSRGHLISHVLGELARLLLAEPEVKLERVRAALAERLGDRAGLLVGLAPELQDLLDAAPEEVTEAPTAQVRLRRAVAELLGAVTVERPVVLFLDDLQWAAPLVLDVVEHLLDDGPPGLLVAGAHRPEAVDDDHPLSVMRHRWALFDLPVEEIEVLPLGATDLARLLTEILRVPAEAAAALAEPVAERTGGNPFDTVELLNALRRDGVLVLGDHGWGWDVAAVRAHVGTGDVIDLLRERLERLPIETREALDVMACVGREATAPLLAEAGGWSVIELCDRLLPALEDGLVLTSTGSGTENCQAVGDSIRFRHDRVQQAVHDGLAGSRRRTLVLELARRLAGSPEHRLVAAALYLEARDRIPDMDERVQAVGLFREAADAARAAGDLPLVERNLEAATGLHLASGGDPNDEVARAIDALRHSTLIGLGRLAEADRVYERIVSRDPEPAELAMSIKLQISTLAIRHRPAEALAIGWDILARLGFPTPTPTQGDGSADIDAEVRAGHERATAWLGTHSLADDLARPTPTDPAVLAAAAVMRRMCPAAYFSDHLTLARLVTLGLSLWIEHGPQPELIPVLGHANSVVDHRGESRDLNRDIVTRALEVGEANAWEPVTAHTHFLSVTVLRHWYEPLEDGVSEARRARDVLLAAGETVTASFTYYPAVTLLLELSHLASVEAEYEAAIALASRIGNDQMVESLSWYRELVADLRGDPDGGVPDAEQALASPEANNSMAVLHRLVSRTIVAAIRGDEAALGANLEAVEPVQEVVSGTYHIPRLEFLRGLHGAMVARRACGVERIDALERLDRARDQLWFDAERSPQNFLHLALLLDAERAVVDGDPSAAAAYDRAIRAVDRVDRPWHHALIAERAGRYLLAQGMERLGLDLLAEAQRRYADWGATAVAEAIGDSVPGLDAEGRNRRRLLASAEDRSVGSSPRSENLDMLAILEASQAIGSQTDPDQLNSVIVERLQSLTGATGVVIVSRDPQGRGWVVRSSAGDDLSVTEAADRGLLPLAAFHSIERTGRQLLVADATHDDRFAGDPFVAARSRCSVLGVPILAGGQIRAVLILTNDLVTGAFTAGRLDAVELLGGQLAVSLDNALLYRSLEAMVASRTRDLEEARAKLERLSLTDPLAGVANRRRFEHVLAADWTAALTRESWLAVAMIDIDHFKQLNDAYGHPAGDDCIRKVAAALDGVLRANDLLARYGGDEFAAILPGSSPASTLMVGERLRRAVADLGIAHPSGRPVSVSIGVASVKPDDLLGTQTLLDLADAALYGAKESGRDRVMAAGAADHDAA